MTGPCARLRASMTPASPSGPRPEDREHSRICECCRRVGDTLAHIPHVLASADPPPLDDITRESILRRMAPELDALCAQPRRTLRWRAVAVATVAIAAAAAMVVVSSRHAGTDDSAPGMEPSAGAVAARPPIRLQPLVVEGTLARDAVAESLLGASLTYLRVPDGARVGAHVPDGAIELRGPIEVSIREGLDGGWELVQRGGHLIVEIDARDGRPPIRIRTLTALVEVVGTAFSIRDEETATRVSVLRGAVEVDGRRIEAGHPLDPRERAAIEAHVASRRPPPRQGRLIRALDPDVSSVRVGASVIGHGPLLAWVDADPQGDAVEIDRTEAPRPPRSVTPAAPSPAPGAERTARASANQREAAAHELPPAEPPPPALPPLTGAPELYEQAEAALRRDDRDVAAALWRELLAHHPRHRLADLALYDLARLAARRGRQDEALALIDRLLERDRDPTLREPANWLRCRIVPVEHRAGCIAGFRRDFPDSPHSRRGGGGGSSGEEDRR